MVIGPANCGIAVSLYAVTIQDADHGALAVAKVFVIEFYLDSAPQIF